MEERRFTKPQERQRLAERVDSSLLNRDLVPLYIETGCLPVSQEGGCLVLACAEPIDRIPEALAKQFYARVEFLRAGRTEIIEAIEHAFRDVFCEEAAYDLERSEPQLSARRVVTRKQIRHFAIATTVLILCLLIEPSLVGVLLTGVVAVGYIANAIFRGWLFWIASDPAVSDGPTERPSAERGWPSYTILVPLYREANVVPQIVQAIRALDYPRERLDVKLVVEADDRETIHAAHFANEGVGFEVLHVPVGEPRTKPRACNYGLRFARGEFLVIYDAEDQPEPDQLKKAVKAFRNGPPHLACLQARLNFFNARENWLTRMFALDYGLWFDYLLPGLDRLDIPLPLGGTSNHFRVEALRAIHGWDPFNVTEDADLGIRLARLGFRVRTLDSTTYEEATNAFGNWLRQRTRWMKGYMQTWLVHMRAPRQLLRDAGLGGFFGFQLFVGGSVLTALLNPLLWAIFAASFFVEIPISGLPTLTAPLSASLILGNALFAYLAMLGSYRRGWLELSPYGLTVPIYWLLISCAAYRALWQLARNPWHWEKTPHGVSRMKAPPTMPHLVELP